MLRSSIITLLVSLAVSCSSAPKCPQPSAYDVDGARIRIVETTPSTLTRQGQGDCVPDGDPKPQFARPLADFAQTFMRKPRGRAPVIITDAQFTDESDERGLSKRVLTTRGQVIGIDVRSKRGVMMISATQGIDYYCIDVIPGGLIALDLFRSVRP